MKAGTHVKLSKIAEHVEGVVPVGHWAKVVLDGDVKVDEAVTGLRHARAAFPEEGLPPGSIVETAGLFNTSVINHIVPLYLDSGAVHSYLLHTRNSTWRLDVLDEPAPQINRAVIAP